MNTDYNSRQELNNLLNYMHVDNNVIAASQDDQGNLHFKTVGQVERFFRGVANFFGFNSALDEIKAENVANKIHDFVKTAKLSEKDKEDLLVKVNGLFVSYSNSYKNVHVNNSTTKAFNSLVMDLTPKQNLADNPLITVPVVVPHVSKEITSAKKQKKDPLSISEEIKDITKKLKSIDPSDTNQAIIAAVSAMKSSEHALYNLLKPGPLSASNIKDLSKLIFECVSAKKKLKNNPKATENLGICLKHSLTLLHQKESSDVRAAVIFDYLLENILKGANDDQEHQAEAITELIKKKLEEKKIKNSPELQEITALLYPLALLVAFFDKNSKISIADESNIEHEVNAFEREYKAQFENNCSEIWTRDFFRECLEQVIKS